MYNFVFIFNVFYGISFSICLFFSITLECNNYNLHFNVVSTLYPGLFIFISHMTDCIVINMKVSCYRCASLSCNSLFEISREKTGTQYVMLYSAVTCGTLMAAENCMTFCICACCLLKRHATKMR